MRAGLYSISLTLIITAASFHAAYADIGAVGGLGKVGNFNDAPAPQETPPDATAPLEKKTVKAPEPEPDPKAIEEARKREAELQEALSPRGTPLLSISARQKGAYVANLLKHSITLAEKRGDGHIYEIVSLIPVAATRSREGARFIAQFNKNLQGIVTVIKGQGVAANRIRTKTAYYDGVSTQEINIYIRTQ